MRIGINARYLQNIHSGIQNYLLHLLLSLRKIDRANEYMLFFGNGSAIPGNVLGGRFRKDVAAIPTNNQFMKMVWQHAYLPYSIGKHGIDLFHEISFVSPIIKKCPTVITVHDLAFLYFPHCYTRRTLLYFKALLAGSLRRADLVIAVSENTKKDIMDRYSVPGSKIRVVRAGIGEMFRKLSEEERRGKIESVTGKYGIKKKFILAAARITPRKNFVRLVRAFKILKDDGKIDGQLVIVGGEGWLYKDVFKEVSSQGLEEDVIFCGYIPQKDLIYLYNAASVFVYPSLYEGFGMPILEAMSCACPVVASNTSSIPEVCGNAAILVDPVDIEEIADAINRIFNDTRGIRQEMIDKGLDHVKHFSWGKTAKDTLRIYEDVGHMSSL